MNNSVFKVEVFENQEQLNEFFLKNEDIKVIKTVTNGEKRALFYEKPEKIYNYPSEDYEDSYGYGIMGNDYEGWNQKMWKKNFPYGGGWPF